MKKILVTGAAGTIGLKVVQFLLSESKYDVTALDLKFRNSLKKLNKYQKRIHRVYGDINNQELMEDLIKDKDVVIHLAAVIPPLADIKPDLTKVINYEGTKNIINAINKVNPKCFMLFSSSISVYGDRLKNPWIKVTDPVVETDHDYYAKIKIKTEALIRKELKNYSIFRLTAIMGRPKTDPLMFNMPLSTKLEISSDKDTAYAFVKAIDHLNKLKGKTFNLGGGEKCRTTYREFLIEMFKIYGLNYKLLKTFLFAEKNFHCGYYEDSDELENILHYRSDSLISYFKRVKKETNSLSRLFSKILSRPIIFFLGRKSKPLKERNVSIDKEK